MDNEIFDGIAVTNPHYENCAKNFVSNINRVKMLGFAPIEINHWSTVFAVSLAKASQELSVEAFANPINPMVVLQANEYVSRYNTRLLEDSEAERRAQVIESAGHNVEIMIRGDTSGELFEGHHAIMTAMIVEAWSAFEGLAIDLWVAAVNKHPNFLAKNFTDKNKDKNITLMQLSKFDFDIRMHVGDLLKYFDKAKFSDLSQIKDNFCKSYDKESEEIFGPTRDLFIAEKTRHLIAHRSGIVDETYLNFCGGLQPYQSFRVGERIPLDGNIVASQVSACINAGCRIIKFVDSWSCARDTAGKL